MKKIKILIPKGIQYLGDEKMKELMPGFKFETGIYNKEITGCGATTFALKEDKMSVVLLVPRITLLKNKAEQTEDCQAVYGDIPSVEITDYIDRHRTSRKVFICTFDSAARLKKLLGGSWDGYHVYVDEWHVILSDASFKSYTELDLIETVMDAEHLTLLSATPCLDTFVERMPLLKDLPFYEMVWEEKEEIHMTEIKVDRPVDALLKTVRMYQRGCFPYITLDDGTRIESKTLNGFLSSVNGILNIVKQAKLTPENTIIICSENEDNKESLKKQGFEIGELPKRGEKRPTFILSTSTAYMGMDFYSTDALTVVCGNCKKVNTAVDIETELVQICGRERLEENPFRKVIVFFHNDWEDKSHLNSHMSNIEKKHKMSEEVNRLLNQDMSEDTKAFFRTMLKMEQEKLVERMSYSCWKEKEGLFAINELSVLGDEYKARVQHELYQNGMVVRAGLDNNFKVTEIPFTITEHLKNLALKTGFADKMKTYCEWRQNGDTNFIDDYQINMMERDCENLRVYYDTLGPERIKANSYQENRLQEELRAKKCKERIRVELDKRIKVGDEHTAQEWKAILNEIYLMVGIKKRGVRTQLVKDYGYKMEKRTPVDQFGKRTQIWRIVK